MPVDNDLHKAAHKGDFETCKMLIEGSVDEETPITVNDEGYLKTTIFMFKSSYYIYDIH